MNIFLSYSPDDQFLATAVVHRLRSAGHSVMDPHDASAGSDTGEIAQRISTADAVIALVPEAGSQLMFEIGVAVGSDRSMIIATHDSSELPFDAVSVPLVALAGNVNDDAVAIAARVADLTPSRASDQGFSGTATAQLESLVQEPELLGLLSAAEFEGLLKEHFTDSGLAVSDAVPPQSAFDFEILTQASGEVDRRLVVETKMLATNRRVSVDTVLRLAGSVQAARAEAGILISSTDFTAAAVDLASTLPIALLRLTDVLAVKGFDSLAQGGRVSLEPDLYYQRLLHDMRLCGEGWKVTAVSTLASRIWGDEVDQARYADENLAAVARGAEIGRLFVVGAGAHDQFEPLIQRQAAAGIEVRVGSAGTLAAVPELEDFVLFEGPGVRRAYVAHPTVDGLRRIASGRLLLAPDALGDLQRSFARAWNIGLDPQSALDEQAAEPVDVLVGQDPPGVGMEAHSISTPVVTCEEAAAARGIPLAQELKTLLLKTTDGMVAVHLPGDSVLSLRKVKQRLQSAEAYLADPEDLLSLGLSAGTVSAVLDPVWSMPHLISRRLLELPEVMTNDGTRTGYFAFDPALLTRASRVVVGELER